MMAIAFLGYIRSLKWFKYEKTTTKNTISFNNISSNRFYNSLNNYNKNNCNNDRSVSKIVEDFLKDKNLKPVFIYEDLKNQEIIVMVDQWDHLRCSRACPQEAQSSGLPQSKFSTVLAVKKLKHLGSV